MLMTVAVLLFFVYKGSFKILFSGNKQCRKMYAKRVS